VHCSQHSGSNWAIFGYDGLGSVRQVTRHEVDRPLDLCSLLQGQCIGGVIDYDPYGVVTRREGSMLDTLSLGYTGEMTDANALVYLRSRYMNPATGTFLTRDPVEGTLDKINSRNGYGYVEGNPVNGAVGELGWHNRYSYANGNPVNLVDRSGLAAEQDMQMLTKLTSCRLQTDDCIQVSRLTGADTVRAGKVDRDLLNEWGVILTVKCGITNEAQITWNIPSARKQNLTTAFRTVDARLRQTVGSGFKSVLGGLEIRMTGDFEVGNGAAARTPVQQNGFLMIWGEIGRNFKLNVSNAATVNNIIHELGHVLNWRTGSSSAGNPTYAISMQEVGNMFRLRRPTSGRGKVVSDKPQ
jgi:RHS repeat-associated protein